MGDSVSVHAWVGVGVGGWMVGAARGTRQDLVAGRAWMGRKGAGVRGRVHRRRRLLLAQGLQLYVLVVAAAKREQLVVRAGLGDRAVFDEVSGKSDARQHPT